MKKTNKRKQRMICMRVVKLSNLVEVNLIYKAFELIGIYNEFHGEKNGFHAFYKNETENARYHYRNRGIDVIYQMIMNDEGLEECNRDFHISKRSMRRTGIMLYTARVYEGTDYIVKSIFDYISKDDFLYEFYTHHIHNKQISKYLRFQYNCIMSYTGVHYGTKSRCFSEMEINIEEAIENE